MNITLKLAIGLDPIRLAAIIPSPLSNDLVSQANTSSSI